MVFWGGESYFNLSQYYDSFFSSIGLLCGGILFFQGWRLDPILLLSQILLSGTTVFFIIENIYLRNSSPSHSKNVKRIEIISRIGNRHVYKNLKLKRNFSISRNRTEKIPYTKHVSYCRENQNEKALNLMNDSMPSHFQKNIKKIFL